MLCRYGHQSYWDVLRMPRADAVALALEIGELVEAENKKAAATPPRND